jgi:Uma2 family endonuclease
MAANPLLAPEPWLLDVDYPESDGRPMAETDVHAKCIIDVRFMLDRFFADRPDVYVSGNLLLYYEQGQNTLSVAPDIFVVFGVPKRRRRTYRLWEERQAPQFVLEVSSKGTRGEDQGAKRGLYAWLGVQEYVLFDPLEEYLRPPFQGYRLAGGPSGNYVPIGPAGGGVLRSEVLGLELHRRGSALRLHDPQTGVWLPTPDEEADARQTAESQAALAERRLVEVERRAAAAEARAAGEAAARQQAEAAAAAAQTELERLRAELERLRTPPPDSART